MILTSLILTILTSCCDTFCEREKFAKELVLKVENFQEKNGRLPNNVLEMGMPEELEDGRAFYEKKTDSTFIVWYGIGFESKVYYSEKKVWKEEG